MDRIFSSRCVAERVGAFDAAFISPPNRSEPTFEQFFPENSLGASSLLPLPPSLSYFNGDFFQNQNPLLLLPKPEPVEADEWPNQYLKLCTTTTNNNYNPSLSSYLPELRSMEEEEEENQVLLPNHKRLRMILPASPNPSYLSLPAPARVQRKVVARESRKKVSERTRYLQKLMPWNKKMGTATLMEEAYKYIKFLQAQVSVLQSMPVVSEVPAVGSGVVGGLEKLNRQQLLQVLVNSPAAQTILYEKESCVYSVEQVLMLKKMLEMRQSYVQQFVWLGGSSSSRGSF